MSARIPTNKTFHSPITAPSQQNRPHRSSPLGRLSIPGDSLTLSARARDLTFSPHKQWTPELDYEEVSISSLSPGPRHATFICRVVNIYDQVMEDRMPQSARGCLKVLVKDETATILIKLWYASITYDLQLGTLLTCWATHIHSTSSLAIVNERVTPPASPIMTSIFPERDSGCHVQIVNEEDRASACCRTPLGYFSGDPLPGLISLDQYINGGGSDNPNARLLVCVSAIEEVTIVTTKTNTSFLTLAIGITDHSSSSAGSILSLSPPLFPSAQSWRINKTILLLSSPKLLPSSRLITTRRSHIEIDPDISEAVNLRKSVQRENCPINQPFPSEMFDVGAIESAAQRLQFTFQTLAEFVNAAPDERIAGYISVVLSQVNLVALVARKMLFSMECCGMPVYANGVVGRCAQCGGSVALRVNPNLVGAIADESGAIGVGVNLLGTPSKASWQNRSNPKKQHSEFLWSDEAWCQLLGRGKEELAGFCREDVSAKTKRENENMLQYLEQRLQWMRVVLLVGWTGDVFGGRLAILRVAA